MSDSVKKSTVVGVMEEVTEGTYLAPASATDYIQLLNDGFELNNNKDLIERNVMTGSIGKVTPRTGMKSATGSLPCEARPSGVPGQAPQFGKLMKAGLGAVRTNSTVVTTKSSGNTDDQLQIQDADISKFNVGDIVLVKEAGAFHVSPVISKTTGSGTASITLLVPHPDGNFSNSVTIEKFVTYLTANSNHPTLSVSKYIEGTRLEQATGCRVTQVGLNNFSTQQIAEFSYSFEGLSFNQSLTAQPHTPSYDQALPPIVRSAKVFMNDTEVLLNEVSFSLENTLAFKTTTSSESGKVSSRITDRTISGSMNPYKQSDDVSNYELFNENTEFSIFGYMANPTSSAGEFQDVVAFYLPKCTITQIQEADQDGLLQESITFSATRGTSGSSEELYISFI